MGGSLPMYVIAVAGGDTYRNPLVEASRGLSLCPVSSDETATSAMRGGSACSYDTDSSTAVTYIVSVRLLTTTVTETGAVQRTPVEGVLTNRSLAVDFEVTGVAIRLKVPGQGAFILGAAARRESPPTACRLRDRFCRKPIGVHRTRNKTGSGLPAC